MARDKIMLALSDEALQFLNASASKRKRGKFVSELLEHHARTVSEKVDGDAGIWERIEKQLIRLESLLVMLRSER
jgi:hypothetical protein